MAVHHQQRLDFGTVMTENFQVSSEGSCAVSIFPVSTSYSGQHRIHLPTLPPAYAMTLQLNTITTHFEDASYHQAFAVEVFHRYSRPPFQRTINDDRSHLALV
jgi:hypothetical protein